MSVTAAEPVKKLQIKVEKRSSDYKASIVGNPGLWDCGPDKFYALGRLLFAQWDEVKDLIEIQDLTEK